MPDINSIELAVMLVLAIALAAFLLALSALDEARALRSLVKSLEDRNAE